MRPLSVLAAMLTAQWHAELPSQVRPASIDSKAPRLTSAGTPSPDSMGGFLNRSIKSGIMNS